MIAMYICFRTVSGQYSGLTDRLEQRNLNYIGADNWFSLG